MDTPLRDGDILRIPAMVQQFERTVILRGNVANPGRYRWTPGMRILGLDSGQGFVANAGILAAKDCARLARAGIYATVFGLSRQLAKPVPGKHITQLFWPAQNAEQIYHWTSVAGTQT